MDSHSANILSPVSAIWLSGGEIPVEKIKEFIRAEIPDPHLEPRLHKIIVQHNLHHCSAGHCMGTDPDCVYCKRGFPKDFSDEDQIAEDKARVIYRRRHPNNGGLTHFCKDRKKIFNNSHVVAYNSFLSLRFDCHINVEAVTSVGCIKVRTYVH